MVELERRLSGDDAKIAGYKHNPVEEAAQNV